MSTKRDTVTVILPTYNEADNILPLVREIRKLVPTTATILVVDDSSPDGTAQRVRQFTKTHFNSRIRLLVRTANRGLTNSLKDGIAMSKSDIVIWMDCDFSHPPTVLPKLLQEIDRGADIALASRTRNTGLSLMLNVLAMLLFGNDITDYTTGFLAVRRPVLERVVLRGNYGEYCIDLLVRAKRMGSRIVQVAYISPPRRFGVTKTAPNIATLIHHGIGYITTLIRLLIA